MFQLIYLTFTAPRPDPVAFGVFKEQLKVALANQDALPDTAFEEALSAALTQNHLRARPIEGRQRRRDEPRPIARVLQRALCRCERLHLRVRRELRSGGHEAARGALPGQPSGSSSERIGEGRRDSSSGGHRRARGEKRHRAEEPGEHRVQRNVSERRDAPAHAARDGRDAERQPAQDAARRAGRHLRRQRRAALHPASDRGVPHHDLVRLRSRAHREPHQDGLRGDRRVQKGRPERRAGGRRARRR